MRSSSLQTLVVGANDSTKMAAERIGRFHIIEIYASTYRNALFDQLQISFRHIKVAPRIIPHNKFGHLLYNLEKKSEIQRQRQCLVLRRMCPDPENFRIIVQSTRHIHIRKHYKCIQSTPARIHVYTDIMIDMLTG